MFEFLVPFLIASSASPAIGDVTSTSDQTAHATRQLDLDSLADGLRVVLDERGLTATRSEGASTFTVSENGVHEGGTSGSGIASTTFASSGALRSRRPNARSHAGSAKSGTSSHDLMLRV